METNTTLLDYKTFIEIKAEIHEIINKLKLSCTNEHYKQISRGVENSLSAYQERYDDSDTTYEDIIPPPVLLKAILADKLLESTLQDDAQFN